MVAESGAGGLDARGVLGLVQWLFGRRNVFLGDDVVDGLCHVFLNATDFIWDSCEKSRGLNRE